MYFENYALFKNFTWIPVGTPLVYCRGGHTCRDKEPKTIKAIIERAATQLLVCLN